MQPKLKPQRLCSFFPWPEQAFKTVTYVCGVLVFPQYLLIQIFSLLLLPPVPHVYQNGLRVWSCKTRISLRTSVMTLFYLGVLYFGTHGGHSHHTLTLLNLQYFGFTYENWVFFFVCFEFLDLMKLKYVRLSLISVLHTNHHVHGTYLR